MVTFDPGAPAGQGTRAALVLTLRDAGVPDDEGQRHVCRVWVRRWLTSRRDMTEGEARSLIGRLRRRDGGEAATRALAMEAPTPPELDGTTRAELAAAGEGTPDVMAAAVAAAARLAPGDRPAPAPASEVAAVELPAGAITCGPGPITEEDAATVRAFAAELAERGPAPSVEKLDAVREDQADEPEPEPAPRFVAPCIRCDHEATGDTAAELAAAMDAHATAHAVEPAARTPEEIEAAAVAAVERFQARQAAGEVIEPPNPSVRPPRVVVPHTAAARYCLARCYCRTCPQYAEQAAAAARVYAQELAAARNIDTRRATR